jgi:hypothetical protein
MRVVKMNLLREYIRQILLTERNGPANMFLDEMKASFYSGPKGTLVEKFPDGCEVRISLKDHTDSDTVRFDFIETVDSKGRESDECYKKGYARNVMETVVNKADMYDITLELEVGAYGEFGAEHDDLYRFYGSVGFVPSTNDYGHMIREPK